MGPPAEWWPSNPISLIQSWLLPVKVGSWAAGSSLSWGPSKGPKYGRTGEIVSGPAEQNGEVDREDVQAAKTEKDVEEIREQIFDLRTIPA